MNQCAIVIPSYNPTVELLNLIQHIREKNNACIILVNDGSHTHCCDIFEKAKEMPNIILLEHPINLGKGAALKTGLNYASKQDFKGGVVTADGDGQHNPDDIIKILDILSLYPNNLIIGVRDFQNNIPWRSKFGNVMTKKIFRLITGIALQDTQSGLRGIPYHFIPALLTINSQGYEFELEMLLQCKQHKIAIIEEPISTIYINENQSSHFRPIKDSIKIYYKLLRFLFTN